MAQTTINKTVFEYDRLPAAEGVPLLLRLLKIAGPAGGLIEALLAGDEARRDALALSSIKQWLIEFDPAAVERFLFDVVAYSRMNGEKTVPGMLQTDEFLKVAQFCLKTEFGDFFGDGQGSAFIAPRQQRA